MAAMSVLIPPDIEQSKRLRVSKNSLKVVYQPIRMGTATPNPYTDLSKSFLVSGRMASPSRAKTVLYSILLHVVLIGAPLLLSVWFTNTLDLRTYTRTLLVAPPPPPPAAPPAPASAPVARAMPRQVLTSQGRLLLPIAVPKHIAMVKEAPLPPEPDGAAVLGGVPGGVPGGFLGGVLGGVLSGISAPPPPPPAAKKKTTEPILVGGIVRPPKPLFRPSPPYPQMAVLSRIEGDVVISTIIDAAGNVTDMKVVSGPPLLYTEALKTLSTWKYEPTYLDGEPVAVRMDVTISFRLDSRHNTG